MFKHFVNVSYNDVATGIVCCIHYSAYNYFFWVPLVIPHFGGILGAVTYQLFVGIHAESDDEIERQEAYLEKIETFKGSSTVELYTGHDTISRIS